MKVWLLWNGEYSGSSVVGVYSSLELAQAAAVLWGGGSEGYIDNEDGVEVDADAPMVRAGIARWRVDLDLADGTIVLPPRPEGVGRGEPTRSDTGNRWDERSRMLRTLWVSCDARDAAHAIKIAGDIRAQYLAGQAATDPPPPDAVA